MGCRVTPAPPAPLTTHKQLTPAGQTAPPAGGSGTRRVLTGGAHWGQGTRNQLRAVRVNVRTVHVNTVLVRVTCVLGDLVCKHDSGCNWFS